MTTRYRKKPVVIDAVLFTGDNVQEIQAFTANTARVTVEGGRRAVVIETLEGTMLGDEGDWIIKGIKGEFYPCKPDIFDATYEAVDGD
jgi:hypothetical protein